MQPETAQSDSEVPESALRESAARSVRDSLASVALVLGIFYLVVAPSHLVMLAPGAREPLAALAGGSALLCLALSWIWHRHPAALGHAHTLLVALAGVALVNTVFHFALETEARHTTNFALVAVGAGFLFLSHGAFALVIAVTLLAWLALVPLPFPTTEWSHFGFLLFGASALALGTHAVRVTTHRRLERGRLVSDRERSRAEAELRRLAAELQERNWELEQRNRELDEFAHVASHDLQEPLRKLAAFSALLADDLGSELPGKAATDLRFIREAATRMQQLVQDLLQLSRAGTAALRPELVALDEVVDRVLEDQSLRIIEAKARIERDPLPSLRVDRRLMLALYQNLVANALKFSMNEAPHVVFTVEQTRDGFVLGVRDHGIGVPESAYDEIFKPFRRLHASDSVEGTGIGLAICRKAVERHGGRIWVESGDGGGVHFRFELGPAAAPLLELELEPDQ